MESIYIEKVEKLRLFFAQSGASRAVVALSGGIDSAVVVPLAVAALGRENVRVVLLPTRFSSQHSVDDSLEMARLLEIQADVVNIDPVFESSLQAVSPLFDVNDCGVATENIQARIRCTVTMALCNATGALMLNTSNRSEILVGYGTLYGDTSGAVSVIGDLYKTEVYALAQYINKVQGGVIPQNIITKAPSAELSIGQVDSDSLPEYDTLDAVLRLLVDEQKTPHEIIEQYGYESAIVMRVVELVKRSAFKRLQLPPLL